MGHNRPSHLSGLSLIHCPIPDCTQETHQTKVNSLNRQTSMTRYPNEGNVTSTSAEPVRVAVTNRLLCDQCCFSVSFNLNLVPSSIVRLAFQTSEAEEVLPFFTSLHNSQIDDAIVGGFYLVVK